MQSAALFPPTLLLALPHGQTLERALLQLIAGFGAFLFFRRFGLSAFAALTGGVLFELNGVYAWLHNAIFNPVAFLPWLFLSIENVRWDVVHTRPLSNRLPALCLGGVAGALALYAGFPEQVYLYSLLLLAWAVFRTIGLDRGQVLTLISDIMGMSALCLVLSAPLLVSFGTFLGQATSGHHDGNGFYGLWPPHGTLLQYFLPYIYGPIFGLTAPTQTEVMTAIWGNIGGYFGFAPLIFGCAALLSPERRTVKLFLLAWIVVALGASHGWPGIYPAFMMLPLAKIAACFRYLAISWIFCGIFLVVLYVDEQLRRTSVMDRRQKVAALLSAISVVFLVVVDANTFLPAFWSGGSSNQLAVILAASSAAILAVAGYRAMSRPNGPSCAQAVTKVLVVEAVLWFFVPYLSYPRIGHLDRGTITFLRAHIGHQRLLGMPGYAISPNFGSALDIPQLNYADIPVPEKTVAYIKENLDSHASDYFTPGLPPLPPAEDAERRRLFHERLPAYARAGVKYVLGPPGLDDPNLSPVHVGATMTVYELRGYRSYLSAPGCELKVISWDAVDARCAEASILTRLELALDGWSADINGVSQAVGEVEGAFQTLVLPPGVSRVTFTFRPVGLDAALAAACLALLSVAAVGINLLRKDNRSGAAAGNALPRPAYARRRYADAAWTELRPVMKREKPCRDEKGEGDDMIPPDRLA